MGERWTCEVERHNGRWRGSVFDGSAVLVAIVRGSEHYVRELTGAMCSRRSLDVRDLQVGLAIADRTAQRPTRPQSSTQLRAHGSAGPDGAGSQRR